MFLESEFLLPEEDTLHVVRGIAVSHPNLFLDVTDAELDRFFADWVALEPVGSAWKSFVDRYGVRRTDPKFWSAYDFFEDAFPGLDLRRSPGCSICHAMATTEMSSGRMPSCSRRIGASRSVGRDRTFRVYSDRSTSPTKLSGGSATIRISTQSCEVTSLTDDEPMPNAVSRAPALNSARGRQVAEGGYRDHQAPSAGRCRGNSRSWWLRRCPV